MKLRFLRKFFKNIKKIDKRDMHKMMLKLSEYTYIVEIKVKERLSSEWP